MLSFECEEIDEQGKLTPELKAKILAAQDLDRLEDLYLPCKQKRKTRATVAREAGLEPLTDWMWRVSHEDGAGDVPLAEKTTELVAAERSVATAEQSALRLRRAPLPRRARRTAAGPYPRRPRSSRRAR